MSVNGDISERPSPAKVRGVFLSRRYWGAPEKRAAQYTTQWLLCLFGLICIHAALARFGS